MAERWFLTPIVGSGSHTDPFKPKYSTELGISGWSGQQVTVNGSDYYAVRYVGTTSALDTIESYNDADSLPESSYTKSDLAGYLNNTTGHNYSFAEWEDRFFTGEINV